MNEPQIQEFNLFGESSELPDVVHCETIQVRSRIHDWEFAPHRHSRLHQILLIESGGGRTELDGKSHELIPALFLNVPVGVVHGFSFETETSGWVLTLSVELLDVILFDNEGLRPVLSQPCVGKSNNNMRYLMEEVFGEFNRRRFGRAHLLRAIAAQLLGLVARDMYEADAVPQVTGSTSLRRRFEALVEAHYAEQWSVADYAGMLGVSPTHLSRSMRAVTGRPASRIIEARIVREARRLLAYTNLSISQIAYELGFFDPAYFSRVFTRTTGNSPRGFRSRLDETARLRGTGAPG